MSELLKLAGRLVKAVERIADSYAARQCDHNQKSVQLDHAPNAVEVNVQCASCGLRLQTIIDVGVAIRLATGVSQDEAASWVAAINGGAKAPAKETA